MTSIFVGARPGRGLRALLGLAVAGALLGTAAPAAADRGDRWDRGWHDNRGWDGGRGWDGNRGWHGDRGRWDRWHRPPPPRYYRPRPPVVYVPPPVIYAPPPPVVYAPRPYYVQPGLSLQFNIP